MRIPSASRANDRENVDRRVNGSPDRNVSNGQPASSSPPRPATANQVKAIRAIAHRAGVDLASELSQRFGLRSPQALTLGQASQLIDALKELLDAQPVAG